MDTLIDAEHDFTISPVQSPELHPVSPPIAQTGEFADGDFLDHSSTPPGAGGSSARVKAKGKTTLTATGNDRSEDPIPRTQTLPVRAFTPPPSTFTAARPSTPSQAMSPPITKSRPKISKLNTLNLLSPQTSPTKPLSPGLKHWQQVRAHVLAPTPVEERAANAKAGKKLNIVSKAAGKFGFRQAADNVLGYEERRRRSTAIGLSHDLDGLSVEEQEEVARERRRFARDVKACLDACATEETRRRLQRGAGRNDGNGLRSATSSSLKTTVPSSRGSQHLGYAQRFHFDPDFSCFAPLLTELHRHLPGARAKKLWSRTCPHHAAILSELAVNFLPDNASTDGERQQALEVFGVVVRNWASDSAEEELDRWLFLCRALLVPDKHIRNRGLPLLTMFLQADPDLPRAHDRPHTAAAFQSIAIALLEVLHALETKGGYPEHQQAISGLLTDLIEGNIIELDLASLKEVTGSEPEGATGGGGGVERELLWMAVGRLLGRDTQQAEWLMGSQCKVLSVSHSLPSYLNDLTL